MPIARGPPEPVPDSSQKETEIHDELRSAYEAEPLAAEQGEEASVKSTNPTST